MCEKESGGREMSKLNAECFKCKHKRSIPGDCHIECANKQAKVVGHEIGKKKGWFFWPFNFDPVWLVSCDGFEPKEADK
jgi:hypothetical protein